MGRVLKVPWSILEEDRKFIEKPLKLYSSNILQVPSLYRGEKSYFGLHSLLSQYTKLLKLITNFIDGLSVNANKQIFTTFYNQTLGSISPMCFT